MKDSCGGGAEIDFLAEAASRIFESFEGEGVDLNENSKLHPSLLCGLCNIRDPAVDVHKASRQSLSGEPGFNEMAFHGEGLPSIISMMSLGTRIRTA